MEARGIAERQGDPTVRILGIPGSVREGSLNISLLETAAEHAAPEADIAIYNQPRIAELPSFDPDAEPPPPVTDLREAVAGADALLIATPEYNGSMPGALKNAIDWLAAPARSGPLRGKPAAVVGADREEVGCDWAHADARKVLEMAGARVIAESLSIEAAADVLGLPDSDLNGERGDTLDRILTELIAEGRAPG